MDNSIDPKSLRESELRIEAEKLFPYPVGACVFVRKKIDWKRDMWVIDQIKADQ